MKKTALSHLCDILIGRTPSRNVSEFWGKGYKWVSISDMKQEVISTTKEEITEAAINSIRCSRIPKGTLLLSFKLSVGKLAFAGTDLYTNEAIAALIIRDHTVLYSKYLYYALKVIKFVGGNQAVMGVTLNSKSLAELKIPLPPLDDQIRIATILTRAEKLIAKRKESIKALDELLKSTFLEMFGDPVRNEKGWEKIRWDNLFNTRTGKLNANAMSEDGEYPFFTCAKEIYQIDFYDFDCEALILAGNNATADYDVKYYKGKFNAYQRTYILELFNPKHTYRFYQYHLEYKLGQLKDGSKGANTRYLTKQFLDPILFLKPPFELQSEFATIVEKVNLLKSKYSLSLAELKNLYGSLSQLAFKGELDLSKVPAGCDDEPKRITIIGSDNVELKQEVEFTRNDLVELTKKHSGEIISFDEIWNEIEMLTDKKNLNRKYLQEHIIEMLESNTSNFQQVFDIPTSQTKNQFSEKQIAFRITNEN